MNLIIIVFAILYIFFLANNIEKWVGWVIFSGSLLVSMSFAYLMWRYPYFAALQLGALTGFLFALIIQEAVLYLINFQFTIHIAIGVFGCLFMLFSIIFIE
jgi:hypothetical protein